MYSVGADETVETRHYEKLGMFSRVVHCRPFILVGLIAAPLVPSICWEILQTIEYSTEVWAK